jgi:hypothetical protein
MKATLEFYIDKPLEHRRMKMAIEAEQAFAVIVALTDYCKHQRAVAENNNDNDKSITYQSILDSLSEFLKSYEIDVANYKEIESLLKGVKIEVETKQGKNGMAVR